MMVFMEYLPGDSLFHKLDVRTKSVWLASILILSFIFTDPLYVGVIGVVVLLTGFMIGMSFSRLRSIFQPLIPIMLCILLFTGFGVQPESFIHEWARKIIFQLFGLPITVGGLLIGVTYLLRLLIIVLSTSIVTLTTPLEDFVSLMRKMRLPYAFAFAFSTAVRFVPTLMKESDLVMDAQRARGMELDKGGFIQQIKNRIPVMVPMIVGGIRRADNLAIAMLIRGFGASEKRTTLYEIAMRRIDYMAISLIVSLTCIGIVLRLMGYGML